MLWEVFFMLVLLKIPVVYLCAVVWWAIKAEPEPPGEGAPTLVRVPLGPGCDWRRAPLLGRRGPLPRVGGPSGRRVPRAAYARARSMP